MFHVHVLHFDLDAIVSSQAGYYHGRDQTEAEATVQDMALPLTKTPDYEGTTDEKRAFLVYRTLSINYDQLSDEKKIVFTHVCNKSPKLFNVISQRGKRIPWQGKKKRK